MTSTRRPAKVLVAWVQQQLRESGFAMMETVHRRKDGTTFPVEVNLRQVQLDRAYVVSVSRDITERKRAEERLREFERVVESLEEMIVVVDREYRYVLANRAFLSRRGMTKEQAVGRSIAEVLNPGVFETVVKEKLDECLRGKVVNYELKYKYPEMGERDLSLTYFPVEGQAGIDRAACVITDITERKRAEEALRQSEERFRVALKHSPIAVFNQDRDLRYTWMYNSQLPFSDSEQLGKTAYEIFDPEEAARITEVRRRVLETGVGARDEIQVTFGGRKQYLSNDHRTTFGLGRRGDWTHRRQHGRHRTPGNNRGVTRSQEKAYGRKALSRAGNQHGTGVRGHHRAEQGLGSRHGEGEESGGQQRHRAAAG